MTRQRVPLMSCSPRTFGGLTLRPLTARQVTTSRQVPRPDSLTTTTDTRWRGIWYLTRSSLASGAPQVQNGSPLCPTKLGRVAAAGGGGVVPTWRWGGDRGSVQNVSIPVDPTLYPAAWGNVMPHTQCWVRQGKKDELERKGKMCSPESVSSSRRCLSPGW